MIFMSWILLSLVNIFLVAFIYAFSGAVTPGPVLVGVIKETPRHGYPTGPLFIVGHSLCEIPIIILSFFGLATILSIPIVFFVISILGGGTLLFLAGLTLRNIRTVSLEEELIRETKSESIGKHPILQGLILSLVGPYWILWWATAGLANMGTLNIIAFGAIGGITYFVGHILADFAWYTFISAIVASGKKIVTDKVYRIILIISAVIFCYFGGKFIFLALTQQFYGIDLSVWFLI